MRFSSALFVLVVVGNSPHAYAQSASDTTATRVTPSAERVALAATFGSLSGLGLGILVSNQLCNECDSAVPAFLVSIVGAATAARFSSSQNPPPWIGTVTGATVGVAAGIVASFLVVNGGPVAIIAGYSIGQGITTGWISTRPRPQRR